MTKADTALQMWLAADTHTAAAPAFMCQGTDGKWALITPVSRWNLTRFRIFASEATLEALADATRRALNKGGPWVT